MIALALVFILATDTTSPASVLADVRAVKCGEELGCWKLKTLKLDIGLELAGAQLDAALARIGFDASELALWKTKAVDLQKALEAVRPLVEAPIQTEAWHKSPVLWFSLGVASAIALALGIFAASKRIDLTVR